MQFELSKTKAYLSSVNPRAELHGEDKKLAGDLKMRVDLSNDCLAMFAPSLKHALYHFDPQVDGDQIAGLNDENYRPHIRFPHLPSFKWSDSCIGAALTIHHGIDAKHNIRLKLCNIDKFKIEPKQGGTVTITFSIAAHPDTAQFGHLCAMVGQQIEVSIEPPAAAEADK